MDGPHLSVPRENPARLCTLRLEQGIVTVIAGKVEEDKIVIGSDGQRTWGWQAREVLQDGKLMVLPDIIVGGPTAHSARDAPHRQRCRPQGATITVIAGRVCWCRAP